MKVFATLASMMIASVFALGTVSANEAKKAEHKVDCTKKENAEKAECKKEEKKEEKK